MYPYQRLRVWQRAHALTVSLYAPATLDESPRYRALVDQLRRSAGAIGANIAEGAGSGSQPVFGRYLGIALASAHELENHVRLARDIGCLESTVADRCMESIESVKRMLTVLQQKVRQQTRSPGKPNGSP